MIQAMFIILAITLPVVALMRFLLGKRVLALMLKSHPQAKAFRAMPGVGPQQQPATIPRVVRLGSETNTGQADEVRHALARPSLALYRRWWLYDALSVSAVLGAYVVSSGDTGVLMALGGYLLVISIRYFLYAGYYKDRAIRGAGGVGWFRRWITASIEAMFRAYFHPRYALFLTLMFALILYQTLPSLMPWAVLCVVVPLALRMHLFRLSLQQPNQRLLILRVFDVDESSLLTFGAVRDFWQHIGSTFTVVDRSYLRYKYRGHSESQVAIIFFCCMAWALVFGTPKLEEWWFIAPILSVLIIIGYFISLIVLYVFAPRSFAINLEEVQGRVQGFLRRPRRWDLTFKDLDMYCHDANWLDNVAELIDESDVVLMDLRGYSAKNKGCETEVDYLFDHLPVSRIIFVVNENNDVDEVEQLILKLWATLKPGSPNLQLTDPVATIYNIEEQGKEDVRGLANALAAGACSG